MNLLRLFSTAGLLLLGAHAALADSTYTYKLANGSATITGLASSASVSGALTVPATVDGYTVVAIGPGTFLGQTAITSVSLPSGVTAIEAAAFADCTKLASLTLPSGLKTIGESAFQGCTALTAVSLPSGVTTVSAHAFDGCRVLALLTLNPGLVTIGARAFANADALTAIDVPDTVTTVGAGAFRDCDALASLTLGAAVSSLGDGFATGCRALSSITVRSGNGSFASTAGVLFDATRTRLILAPPALTGSYAVPSTVTTLAAEAFSHSSFTSIGLPAALTTISEGAFYYAQGLVSLSVPETVSSIGAWAFGGCNGLATITLPASLATLADNAFNSSRALTTATFNGNAPTTGSGCFDNTAATFTIYYTATATGFSSPTWMGYPAICLGTSTTLAAPSVNTDSAVASLNSAAVAGTVTSANGATVTARGFVYSTAASPTLASGTAVAAGSGLGSFSATLSGLSVGTVYHVRAYATNSEGTSYGADVSFTTTTNFAAPVPDGYGASATGGAAGTSVVAGTAAEFTTYATSANAHVITVSGHLAVGTVAVGSNKTIQGADASATLDGCLGLNGVSNVIIRGLNLANPDGHALQLANASKVYVTRCTFLDCAGRQIMATGSDQVTISWCEFAAAVSGQSAVQLGSESDTATAKISLHHNWWSTGLGSGLPAAASGYVHQYSDYIAATGNTTGTAVSGSAQLLSEGNGYVGIANPLTKSGSATLRANANTYTTCTGTTAAGTDTVFTPSYSYELFAAGDVATVVPTLAGNTTGAAYTELIPATASIGATATTVNSGASCTLTATLSGATASSYQWRLVNAPLSGATASTYKITSMSSSTAGTYTVAIGLADGSTVVSTPTVLTLGTSTSTNPGTSTNTNTNTTTTTSSSGGGGGGACGLLLPAALLLLGLARGGRGLLPLRRSP